MIYYKTQRNLLSKYCENVCFLSAVQNTFPSSNIFPFLITLKVRKQWRFCIADLTTNLVLPLTKNTNISH